MTGDSNAVRINGQEKLKVALFTWPWYWVWERYTSDTNTATDRVRRFKDDVVVERPVEPTPTEAPRVPRTNAR